MAAQPPTIQFGILKCRDLVNIYYGARLVVNVVQSFPTLVAAAPPLLILKQNPARIRYEIAFNLQGAAFGGIEMGQLKDFDTGATMEYNLLQGTTMVITRDFLTDLEGVTLEQYVNSNSDFIDICIRETILTASPIDEGP